MVCGMVDIPARSACSKHLMLMHSSLVLLFFLLTADDVLFSVFFFSCRYTAITNARRNERRSLSFCLSTLLLLYMHARGCARVHVPGKGIGLTEERNLQDTDTRSYKSLSISASVYKDEVSPNPLPCFSPFAPRLLSGRYTIYMRGGAFFFVGIAVVKINEQVTGWCRYGTYSISFTLKELQTSTHSNPK